MPRDGRVPDWLLERVALGEVPEAHAATIEQQCRDEETAAQRLEEIAAANEAFLTAHPVGEVVAEIERRCHVARTVSEHGEKARASRRWAWAAATTAAVTAATALVLYLAWPNDHGGVIVAVGGSTRDAGAEAVPQRDPSLAPGGTLVKGGRPHLLMHRSRGPRPEPLKSGQSVGQGDRVQLSYVAAKARFGVILSIDGRGVVTMHYPEEPGGTTGLERRGKVHLAHSYQLDDAPGFERFFFVTSQRPIEVEAIWRAAESLASTLRRARTADLVLDAGLEQSSFLLRKESKR